MIQEEKEKLFDAIKTKGYKWNTETKTLEKLPKSYKEEEITNKAIFDCNAQCCDIMNSLIKEKNGKEESKTLKEFIKPKFKVGDKIKHKDDKTVITITGIKNNYYFIQFYNSNRNDYQNEKVSFEDQYKYELVSNKFDITTLKPFDKVLIRSNSGKNGLLISLGL